MTNNTSKKISVSLIIAVMIGVFGFISGTQTTKAINDNWTYNYKPVITYLTVDDTTVKNKYNVKVYWKKPPTYLKNSAVYFRLVKVNSKNKIVSRTAFKKISNRAYLKKGKRTFVLKNMSESYRGQIYFQKGSTKTLKSNLKKWDEYFDVMSDWNVR